MASVPRRVMVELDLDAPDRHAVGHTVVTEGGVR